MFRGNIKFLFIQVITAMFVVIISSCVPKVTEKKALCEANEKFNTTTRTCYSVAEVRTTPVATLSSDATLIQETAKELILTYTDKNNDSATSCTVSGVASQVNAISPLLADGTIHTKISNFNSTLGNLSSVFHNYRLTHSSLAVDTADDQVKNVDLVNITTYANTMSTTFNLTNFENTLASYMNSAEDIIAQTSVYTSDTTVNYFYNLAVAYHTEFLDYYQSIQNKCYCSGGICKTHIIPKKDFYGSAGFTYTISDVDGSSDAKTVSLTVSAYAKTGNAFKPAVESVAISGTESTSSTPSAYDFTLGTARDYFSTASFTYHYDSSKLHTGIIPGFSPSIAVTYVSSDNGLGKITDCLGLGGSLTSDTTCKYIPDDGDGYEALTPAKAKNTTTVDGLTFTAVAEGTYGNNIKIYYYDLKSDITTYDSYATSVQKYGMVGSSEAYLRVIGDNIYIFFNDGVTSTSDIQTLINNDMKAKSMVLVSGGSSATVAHVASTPSGAGVISLTGGVSGLDTFTYTASNSTSSSSNTAMASFHITASNDYPQIPDDYLPSNLTSSLKEDTAAQALTLFFKDVDSTSYTIAAKVEVGGCSSVTTTYFQNIMVNSAYFSPNVGAPTITTDGTTHESSAGITIDTLSNFNGSACLYYTVTDDGGLTSKVQYRALNVKEVNDTPTLTVNAVNTVQNAVVTASGSVTNVTMFENSTANPSSAYACVTATTGDSVFEASQTLTVTGTQVTPTSDSHLVLTFTVLAPNATGNDCTAGLYKISWIPAANYSGTTNITITVTDNGTTEGANDFKTVTASIALTVTAVNDPPYFVSGISTVSTNEGGYVVAGPYIVDEDQANSTDENADSVKITATSDNQTVLMDSGISLFYDENDNGIEDVDGTSESRASGSFLESVASINAGSHAFYLKISPVSGASGNANIVLKAEDASGTPTYYTVALVVNPVSALHGGWKNIMATGLKTDKYGNPASSKDLVCNYNKSTDDKKCSTGDCTRASSPFASGSTAAVTTDAENVIFYDSANYKCYYSYKNTSTNTYMWKQFNTSCPITRSTSVCGNGGNCIKTSTIDISTNTPSATEQYYFDATTSQCFKSKQTAAATFAWNTSTYSPSKITLTWGAFSLTGSGVDALDYVKGYNVYRREPNKNYDFNNGYLKNSSSTTMTIPNSSTLEFTDTTAEAGKVYYYTVRAVDKFHSLPTYTPEIISEVRVIAPGPNSTFVHRWMINQEICGKMHATISNSKVDITNNYRCAYYGPGSSGGYFDYGNDLMVDMAELGCPYTLNTNTTTHCTNGANGCIGIGKPNPYYDLSTAAIASGDLTLSHVSDKDIYYDRNAGSCYIYDNSLSAWVDFSDTTNLTAALITSAISSSLDQYSSALNPPLANITEQAAVGICNNRTAPTIYKNATTAMVGLSYKLPEKPDFIAYSAHPLNMTESAIADLEQGDSLNAQSRCNSSNASGLASYYSDSQAPTTSYLYTVPGTSASGIRSIYNGSIGWGYNYGTESCISRYGIQDLYGNVAEWTKDVMSCASTTDHICKMDSTINSTQLSSYLFNPSIATSQYAFNLLIGPFNDSSGSGVAGDSNLDSFLNSWLFEEESYEATKLNFPTGMPFYSNYSRLISCPYSNSSASCTNGTLGCIYNSDPTTLVVTGANNEIALDTSTGKCYKSNGVTWSEVTYTTPSAAGVDYLLDIGSTNGITYSELHGDEIAINGTNINADSTHKGAFAVGGSYLSTSKSGRYNAELVPLSTRRPDIGMRCIIKIDKTKYDTTDTTHPYMSHY